MTQVTIFQVEKEIRYWRYTLSKIEQNMLKMQSERIDVKRKLVHLMLLQQEVESETQKEILSKTDFTESIVALNY